MADLDIAAWLREIIEGPSGMNSFEEHELVVWHLPERVAVADWTLRCLANPDCKGSGEVLAAILEHRQRVKRREKERDERKLRGWEAVVTQTERNGGR